MTPEENTSVPDLLCDPFQERRPAAATARLHLLGGRFEFASNSEALLRLALSAFAGLPGHRLAKTVPRMRVRLVLSDRQKRPRRSEPPPLGMFSAGGAIGGATDSSDFVLVSPHEQTALIVVSPRMLRYPYHLRYELLEFAVFTLAARVQGLAPLHAACVGRKGRGVLLMGDSGAGKSTVALQCLLHGLDFLAEDGVFVCPQTLLATGVSNFIHIRSDAVRWISRARDVAAVRNSPVIRRRSGVRKFELDLRRGDFRLAAGALRIAAVAFLSPRSAGDGPLLLPLPRSDIRGKLMAAQPYAASQPEWPAFVRNVARLPVWELRRGRHPLEAAQALSDLFE
jgi:hypothetical protein